MTHTVNFRERSFIRPQINPVLVFLLSLIGTAGGCAIDGKTMTGGESACLAAQETERKVPPTLNNVDDYLTVDCLLPGQPIHLGNMVWMSPGRPAIISAWDCNVQGGQYAIGANSDARQMAINVWQQCADQGDKVAQNYLGEIYARSWNNIKPDFTRAAEWFRKAADQGYSRAQKNLGTLYEQGLLGTPKDPETAFKLYRQAIGPVTPVSLDPNIKGAIQELTQNLKDSQQQLSTTQQRLQQKQEELDTLKKQNPSESNQAQAQVKALLKDLEKVLLDEQKFRGQLVKTKAHAALGVRPYMGQYYALIIGINDYQASLDPLKTPVNDAKQVDAILREQYGFKTTLLTDDTATRGGIFKALEEIKDTLAENDNLLIYYAGHGDISSSNRYHWLPQDADSKDDTNWISLDDIKKKIDNPPMKAKRVLIVADSCYPAGLIASVISATPITTATINFPLFATRSPPTTFIGSMSAPTGTPNLADTSPEAQVGWIKAKSENLSRTAMTSGLLEPVPDVDSGNGLSIFANAFLEALRKNDDVISAEQIYLEISPEVFAKVKKIVGKNQMPAYGAIPNTGHNFGEFFFVSHPHQSKLQEIEHRTVAAATE